MGSVNDLLRMSTLKQIFQLLGKVGLASRIAS